MIASQSHSFALLFGMLAGLETGLANLSAKASDGRQIRAAWRALRAPAPPRRLADPHEATSVAPPGY